VVFVLVFLCSALAGAAGVTFLPGHDRESASEELALQPSLAVPVWELPGGLLVADRLAAADGNRFGPSLPRAFPAGEWFVVDTRRHARQPEGAAEHSLALARYGQVHLSDAGVYVVEVAADRLTDFAACNLERQRIVLDPPPAGWQHYAAAITATAAGDAARRADDRVDRSVIEGFLSEGDETSFRQILQEISGAVAFMHEGTPHTVYTRYYDTADKNLVADYLAATLTGYGYTVEFDEFRVSGVDCRNVVATLLGTTMPDEYVVVGGHYDATSEQPYVLAPGAEDDGSGTSLVMEIARMAAGHDFERSIQFVLFDSEEQGLNGSEHFVEEAVGAGRVIVGAIIADMVTYYAQNYGVIIEGQNEWEWLMSIMETSVETYTTLTNRKDYYSWGSDHVPFQQAGIPAFLAIDWDWNVYPYYHNSTDNWQNVEATAHIGHEITQACAATLAEVAGLLGPPAEAVITPLAFDVTVPVDGAATEHLTIGNDGAPGSVLGYALSQNSAPLAKRSIAGSDITPSPSQFTPGETTTYTLTVFNASTDAEWLDEITLDFPPGVSVLNSTDFVGGSDGPLVTNGATGDGAFLEWTDQNGSWGNIHEQETATADVTLQFTPDLWTDLNVPFTISGDVYGDEPHDIAGTVPFTIHNPATWLTLPVSEGQCEVDEYHDLLVEFDATGLAAGDYGANITVAHSAGDDVVIPVLLHVDDSTDTVIAAAGVRLYGNHPNPFNPQTTIDFELPRAERVELAVFDVNGRRLVTLVDGLLPAGRHSIVWRGRDQQGRVLASGPYFCRLTAGTTIRCDRMSLVK